MPTIAITRCDVSIDRFQQFKTFVKQFPSEQHFSVSLHMEHKLLDEFRAERLHGPERNQSDLKQLFQTMVTDFSAGGGGSKTRTRFIRVMLPGSVTCVSGVRRCPAEEKDVEVLGGRARLSFQDFEVVAGDCIMESFLGRLRRITGLVESVTRFIPSVGGTGIEDSGISNGVARPSFRVS